MKSGEIEQNPRLPYRKIARHSIPIKSIQDINYDFDPNSPEYNIITHTLNTKDSILSGSYSPNELQLNDQTPWLALIYIERQLREDLSYGDDILFSREDLESRLQKAALSLYLAKRWQDWSVEMYTLFENVDEKNASKYKKLVLQEEVYDNYKKAVNSLILAGRALNENSSAKTKNAWARMIVFTLNHLQANSTLPEDIALPKERYDAYVTETITLFQKYGFEHLIQQITTNPKPAETSYTEAITNAVTGYLGSAAQSASNAFYSYVTNAFSGYAAVQELPPTIYKPLNVSHDTRSKVTAESERIVDNLNNMLTSNPKDLGTNSDAKLITENLEQNLYLYAQACQLMTRVEKEYRGLDNKNVPLVLSPEQQKNYNAITDHYFKTYLNPACSRILDLFDNILSQRPVTIPRHTLLEYMATFNSIYQAVNKLHLSYEFMGLDQNTVFAPRVKVITEKIDQLGEPLTEKRHLLFTFTHGATSSSSQSLPANNLAFKLINQTKADEFEMRLIKDNYRLHVTKNVLDEYIKKKYPATEIYLMQKRLAFSTNAFLEQLAIYYKRLDNKEALLAEAKQELLQQGLLIPEINFNIFDINHELRLADMPAEDSASPILITSASGSAQIQCKLEQPVIHGFATSSAGRSDNTKETVIDLNQLKYVAPSTSMTTEDLRILQSEAQLNLWLETLSRLAIAHDKLVKEFKGNTAEFIKIWLESQPSDDVFDFVVKSDTYISVCKLYVEQSIAFNALLDRIKSRYAAEHKDPADVVNTLVKKYSLELQMGFVWLDVAINKNKFSNGQEAKNLYLDIVHSYNIGFIKLLPNECISLRKRLYENYPVSLEDKFAGIKATIRQSGYRSLAGTEMATFDVDMLTPSLITGIVFNFNVLGTTNPFSEPVNIHRRIGKFKFRPEHAKDLERYKQVMLEEARCVIYENHLLDAFRNALLNNDTTQKYTIAIEFTKIAKSYEKLRDKVSGEDFGLTVERTAEVNRFICEKLTIAYDAIAAALMDNKISSKEREYLFSNLEELTKKLKHYVSKNLVNREYLTSAIYLEPQLYADKNKRLLTMIYHQAAPRTKGLGRLVRLL